MGQQEEVPPQVYPGDPDNTPWCRGQIVFYGGSTAAERDEKHIGFPEGYLGDMWLYNVSSNTIRLDMQSFRENVCVHGNIASCAGSRVHSFGMHFECLNTVCSLSTDKGLRVCTHSEIKYSRVFPFPSHRRGNLVLRARVRAFAL